MESRIPIRAGAKSDDAEIGFRGTVLRHSDCRGWRKVSEPVLRTLIIALRTTIQNCLRDSLNGGCLWESPIAFWVAGVAYDC